MAPFESEREREEREKGEREREREREKRGREREADIEKGGGSHPNGREILRRTQSLNRQRI